MRLFPMGVLSNYSLDKQHVPCETFQLEDGSDGKVRVHLAPFTSDQNWEWMSGYCMKDGGKMTFRTWVKNHDKFQLAKNYVEYVHIKETAHGDERVLLQRKFLGKRMRGFINKECAPIKPKSGARVLTWMHQSGCG